jgi:2-hydroxychromene-2-carboxylate isomerase
MSQSVDFFWDAASPYTYLAATQLATISARTGAAFRWKPMLLGKVFEATGNRMPAAIPAKGRYLFKDCQLWASFYGVPFVMPPVFPVNSVLAGRLALAAAEQGPAVGLALMQAAWARGLDISLPEVATATLAALGLDAQALMAATQEPVVKDALRSNTEEATRRGVFGAPSFFLGEQMFWGNDRLPLLEARLLGKL